METGDVVRLFQVHEAVEFREGQTTNVSEVLGHQVLGELREHRVDGYQVYSLRLPGCNEIHLLNPRVQELSKLYPLSLVKNCQDLTKEPVVVHDNYPVDVGDQGRGEAVLQSPWRALGRLVLYQVAGR